MIISIFSNQFLLVKIFFFQPAEDGTKKLENVLEHDLAFKTYSKHRKSWNKNTNIRI